MTTPVAEAAVVRRTVGLPHDAKVDTYIQFAADFLASLSLSTKISADLFKGIETYVAAHFASLSLEGPPLASQSLGDATERYHNIYAAGLLATRFGQQAVVLDISGTLSQVAAQAQKGVNQAQFNVI